MLALFERLGDPNLQMIGEWSLGAALFHLGELEDAHDHLMRGLALYDPAFHGARVWQTGIEPGIFCRCELSRTFMLRGLSGTGAGDACSEARPARAGARSSAAARLRAALRSHGTDRPQDAAPGARDVRTARRAVPPHGIAQELQWAAPLRGRALVELGETEGGVREMEEGLAAHTITRSALLRPYYLMLYAGALIRVGRESDANRVLDEAAAVAASSGQPAFEAERHRLQGALVHKRARTRG